MTLRHALRLSAATALAIAAAPPAIAQEQGQDSGAPISAEPADILDPEQEVFDDGDEIVVTGQRLPGQVIGDIPPENTLDTRDIRATGATDISELLEAIEPQIGSARGRGGGRPVMLLNGQRISSFRELRDIPTEAIARVEVLPEEVALKYGYRADQRVVNFVLRPRFRSTVAQVEGGAATDGGYARGELDLDRLMIGNNGRTMISLDAEANTPLTEAERDIAFNPDADGPDTRPFRTLVRRERLLRGSATVNRQLFGDVSATLNGELEHSEGRSLFGLSDVLLDPLVRDTSSDSAHLGGVLNGMKSGWRWSATGNADLVRSVTESDRRDDAGGDRARTVRRSADIDLMTNGRLLDLPGGEVSATFRAGARTFHLDAHRRSASEVSSNSLGRSQGSLSANVDLPVSRRSADFSALGNLTVNANGEIEQLSDFGTLATYGAGLNWSPLDRLDLLASWTREEGAPSIQQLGDPILETPGSRIFDFTRGETVLVTAITGGNPALDADRRDVLKIGGNWRPLEETNLRLRGEYVRSMLRDPVASFPGPSETLEAAFPERFVRDAGGQLVSVDLRPVNFESARRDTFRWGMDFTKPLRSRPPSQAAIEQFRARRAAAGGTQRPGGAQPQEGQQQQQAQPGSEGTPPQREAQPQDRPPQGEQRQARGPGRGGFGRFGNRQGGRFQFSFTHTVNLVDEVTIGPGIPELDYLAGEAVSQFGGRPRHEVQGRAGWANNGLGAFLSANYRSGTRVANRDSGDLRFSPLATFDLRLFANLGEQFDLVARHPWLRGSSVRLEVDNLFNARPRVRDAFGEVPFSYQPDLLDPLGRTVSISFRKLFLPRGFRGGGRPGGGGSD